MQDIRRITSHPVYIQFYFVSFQLIIYNPLIHGCIIYCNFEHNNFITQKNLNRIFIFLFTEIYYTGCWLSIEINSTDHSLKDFNTKSLYWILDSEVSGSNLEAKIDFSGLRLSWPFSPLRRKLIYLVSKSYNRFN